MLTIIETHPIQYHAPVYRAVAERCGIPVTVVYGSDFSVAGYRDQEFGTSFKWDTDLLSGYASVFLSTVAAGGPSDPEKVPTHGISAAVANSHPSAVMVVGYGMPFHRMSWLAAHRSGVPIIFRGEASDDAVSRDWLKSRMRDTALRAAYRRCARVLFIGDPSRRHYERLGVPPGKLVFSPYCVDTTPFQMDEAARERLRSDTRARLGLQADDRALLFSGKLSHRKGVDLIVAAVGRWSEARRRQWTLLFLGDGELRAELERQTAELGVQARFLGFQNQKDLSPFYHAADLLTLPSRHSETWGLVVNEALHHGLPVVVSDRVGSSRDLVVAGKTGAIAAHDSVEGLLAAIDETEPLLGLPATRTVCRDQVAPFSVVAAAEGIAAAFRSVAQARQVAV